MPFKLLCQFIDMRPLKGGFVEFNVAGDMVGDEVDWGTVQNTKSLSSDLVEGWSVRNARIRKELEKPAPLCLTLIALTTLLIHLLFAIFLRRFTYCRTWWMKH